MGDKEQWCPSVLDPAPRPFPPTREFRCDRYDGHDGPHVRWFDYRIERWEESDNG